MVWTFLTCIQVSEIFLGEMSFDKTNGVFISICMLLFYLKSSHACNNYLHMVSNYWWPVEQGWRKWRAILPSTTLWAGCNPQGQNGVFPLLIYFTTSLFISLERRHVLKQFLYTGMCFSRTQLPAASNFHCCSKKAPYSVVCKQPSGQE